ncbi:MAG: DUF3253 domain-containing protein [Planctomycetota bacterium]|nr:DUF3253 domain-containing protein [Planctomycetota bacterium]
MRRSLARETHGADRRPARLGSVNHQAPSKACAVCGREITWRKKWERCWDEITRCSEACKRRAISSTDEDLERTMRNLLLARGPRSSICPSEAARAVGAAQSSGMCSAKRSSTKPDASGPASARHASDRDGSDWRQLMPQARAAALRLVAQGFAEITQAGKVVDGSRAVGPIRVRLAASSAQPERIRDQSGH